MNKLPSLEALIEYHETQKGKRGALGDKQGAKYHATKARELRTEKDDD